MRPHILIVDDEPRFRALYTQTLEHLPLEISRAETAEQALAILAKKPADLVISDVRLPGASGIELLSAARERGEDTPFLLVTAYAEIRDAVSALKLGAVDYLAKPLNLDELLACVQDTLGDGLTGEVEGPPAEATRGLVASSGAMRAILREAWHIAQSDVNVLLTGESGTGKEVLARFIHRNSPRASKPFVPVNCAAIPASLSNSELFGHERGAFTGATSAKKGMFQEANRGVLFLDEIGDMPLELQPTLLRALEERAVKPVGATRDVPVDFRLVAASNRDLPTDVAEGRFRADLFYRLNVIAIELPALRERREDIVPLARHFLAQQGEPKRLASATSKLLLAHDWPGNVRELANAMKRAYVLTRSDVVMPESLPPHLRTASGASRPTRSDPFDEAEPMTLEELERQGVQRALDATGGNRTHAAKILGITRRGLLKKIKRFDM